MTRKMRLVKLPPESCPPTNSPRVRLRVWVRVRVGGNSSGGKFLGDNFPCTMLNARKHLHYAHSFMVNVLIWQSHNRNCSYSLSTVNFLEEKLSTLALAITCTTFGKVSFSKELLFRNTCSLNFLLSSWLFWEQLLWRGSIWSLKFL